jgi:hypothetical protein
LLYISTTRVPHSRIQLDNILAASRLNNAAADITRIDTRHFAPVIIKREAVEKRLFGRWALGFQPGGAPNGISSMSDEVRGLVAPIDDPLLKAYFEGFARRYAA